MEDKKLQKSLMKLQEDSKNLRGKLKANMKNMENLVSKMEILINKFSNSY